PVDAGASRGAHNRAALLRVTATLAAGNALAQPPRRLLLGCVLSRAARPQRLRRRAAPRLLARAAAATTATALQWLRPHRMPASSCAGCIASTASLPGGRTTIRRVS